MSILDLKCDLFVLFFSIFFSFHFFLSQKDKIKRNDLIDDCIEIPCIGPLQPENDLSIPQVAVDKMAGAALLRGADLFAPGVIALSDGAQNGSKVAVYIDLDKTLVKCEK